MTKATHFRFFIKIHRVDQNKSTSKQFGKNIHRRSQGVSKTFRALIYKAHHMVIFAIAQRSYLGFVITSWHQKLKKCVLGYLSINRTKVLLSVPPIWQPRTYFFNCSCFVFYPSICSMRGIL